MALFCQAKANCGFFYSESVARDMARSISRGRPADPVAVYSMAGTFHIYLAPIRIEGFGKRIATYLAGEESNQ